jgi:hypothetical protein
MATDATATPAPETPKAPDAIKFRTGWEPKGEPFPGISRTDQLCGYFERILGGNPQDKPAWVRQLSGGNMNFVSLDKQATVNFPTGHKFEKFPMYTWYPQPNGLEYGYLKPEAQPTPENVQALHAARAAQSQQATSDMLAWREQATKIARLKELVALGPNVSDELKAEREQLHADLMANCEIYRSTQEIAGQATALNLIGAQATGPKPSN